MTQSKRVLMAVFVLLLLVVTPAAAQTARQRFQWVIAERLTVTANGITVQAGDVAVTAGVTAADVTASDDVGVGDDLTVTGDMVLTAPVRASLSATQTLTPITSNVPISSSAAAGILPVCAAGGIFHIHNVGTQSIVITDSGTSKINGTYTMGNSDSITLLGVGSNCVELARSNN
jgi:hypothetical protein